MKKSKYLILGGGMVAGYAAKEMVERGLKAGELSIISADDAIPYERPPLSKGFLAGKEEEEKIRINPEEFYREHGIDLKLGVEVAGVDVAKRVLRLRSGGEAGFEKLVIATGAAVQDPGHPRRRLERDPLPSLPGRFEAHSGARRWREAGRGGRQRIHRDGGRVGAGAEGPRHHDDPARRPHMGEDLHTGNVAQFRELLCGARRAIHQAGGSEGGARQGRADFGCTERSAKHRLRPDGGRHRCAAGNRRGCQERN